MFKIESYIKLNVLFKLCSISRHYYVDVGLAFFLVMLNFIHQKRTYLEEIWSVFGILRPAFPNKWCDTIITIC